MNTEDRVTALWALYEAFGEWLAEKSVCTARVVLRATLPKNTPTPHQSAERFAWFNTPANLSCLGATCLAGSKDQGYWATIYQWCANAAPEDLFDASFDEWLDDCLTNQGKKKKMW
jgi:hypothetical protein